MQRNRDRARNELVPARGSDRAHASFPLISLIRSDGSGRANLGECTRGELGAGRPVGAAGCTRGCRTNQRRGRLFVGLPQGDGFGVNHLAREGPARAAWAALTRSAKTAIVKFVQAVWFVRQPCVTNAEGGIYVGGFVHRRCCAGDGGLLALQRRPSGEGPKPPRAALAEDRRGERSGKRRA